jgi:glyoxylase-like metal-dependent hydrolase (beta-lactamase superfamily II)
MSTTCAAILLTHTHADHIGAVADLAEGTGAPVYVPELERVALEDPDAFFASWGYRIRPYREAIGLTGTETLELGGIEFRTIAVPGHSPGHVAFAADGAVFSGDILFAGGVGRTDLPFGDWDTLLGSIRTLAERLPPETTVYPGHGPATTLGAELASNPFLDGLDARARSQ